jgi:hypothetical protein
VPADPGDPVEVTSVFDIGPNCWPATTDGAGRFIGVGIGLHAIHYWFVPASGQGDPIGDFSSQAWGEPHPIAPQPSGYHVAATGNVAPAAPFRVYDEQGDLVREGGTIGLPWSIVPDPSGGSAAYTWIGVDGPRRLETVDAAGEPRGSVVLDRFNAMAVSRSGNVLVVAWGDGRWFDRAANPLTDWFSLGVPGQPEAELTWQPALLADGTMGVHDNEKWLAVVQDGKAVAAPPPAWLAGLPVLVEVVRGGAANAFISSPAPGQSCAPSIEIVAASGKICGTVHLPATTDGCTSVDVGKDGTVFLTAARSSSAPNTFTCSWRWWSGLLR